MVKPQIWCVSAVCLPDCKQQKCGCIVWFKKTVTHMSVKSLQQRTFMHCCHRQQQVLLSDRTSS